MAILVTGAAGFVGLNVTEHLLRAGQDVVGFDPLPVPPRAAELFASLPGQLHMVEGSVLSRPDLERATAATITNAAITAAIHCAVITAGPERERTDPEGIVAVNVQGAVATLAACARSGITRFVYTSSVAVYGTAAMGIDPVPETLAPAPVMIYGMTKLACETLLPRIAETQGIGLAIARLASVFGPWEYATGVRDTLSPMRAALQLARHGTPAILSRPGLGDFCYARDIAAGLAALAIAPTLTQTIYNLGYGEALSAETWCAELQALIPAFQWRQAAPGEPANVISHVAFDRGGLDITALRRDTGYAPAYPFRRAAADYLAWATPNAATTP